jgi:transitional endoplasmic reticulum ATPase
VPDKKARIEIFKVHTKGMPLDGVSLDKIAERTEGYAGADIEAVCREAAISALRESMDAKVIGNKHFDMALKLVRPSVTKEIEKDYAELQEKFAQARAAEMKENRPSYFG